MARPYRLILHRPLRFLTGAFYSGRLSAFALFSQAFEPRFSHVGPVCTFHERDDVDAFNLQSGGILDVGRYFSWGY